ncbi:MAG: UxaA family hydrolase [Acidimicrobiales bacterium]
MDQEGVGQVGVLVHHDADDVGVAIRDLQPAEVLVKWLDSERRESIVVRDEVPLGHKVALKDIADGVDVVEYSVRIGLSRRAIPRGRLVHTHNLRSARWQLSA